MQYAKLFDRLGVIGFRCEAFLVRCPQTAIRGNDFICLRVIDALKQLDPTTTIVVLTGYGSITTAVESVRVGATSYLTKPVDADQILAAFDAMIMSCTVSRS